VTAPKCRDCRRPLTTRESQERERGSKCWRAHRAALRLPTVLLGGGRRDWAKEMPGQETLDEHQEGGDIDA
jgi:hypothetical protein